MSVRQYLTRMGKSRWRYRFQFQGEEHKAQGFETRADASKAERDMYTQLEDREKRIRTVYFHDLATRYLNWVKPPRMEPNTYGYKRHAFKEFLRFAGDVPCEEIDTDTVEKFMKWASEQKGKTTKTGNRYIREIKALFNWGIERKIIDSGNPCREARKLKETPFKAYLPSPEDVLKVIMAATGDELDHVQTLILAAVRKTEASRLKWEDVDLRRNTITLYTKKRRGGELRPQVKPMGPMLRGILERRHERRDPDDPYVFSFSKRTLRKMMGRLCKRAGVTRFGFHALRHFAASLMAEQGKDLVSIQNMLGHQRATTTSEYLHLIPGQVYDAVEALEDFLGAKSATGSATLPKNDPKKGGQKVVNLSIWRRERDSNPRWGL